MNLDFNINIARNPATAAPAAPQGAPRPNAPAAPAALTITQAPAAPEDVAAASIPESALTRDDPLGLLVSSAFNLPPPPIPAFPST